MAMPIATALFALGVYLGNPDGSDPRVEQAFEQSYSGFVSTMGMSPRYITAYVDGSQPVDNWAANASWQAWSNAQSPVAKHLDPVIGLQLSSTDANAGSSESQFQAFASGAHDAIVSQVVDAWVSHGFTRLIFRIGQEMNITGISYAGDTASSQAAWVSAFQHVSTVLRAEGRARHVALRVVWNPDTTNYTNASATRALYPGDQYVDIIGADMYADMYPYNDTFNPPTYHNWDTGGEDTSVAQFVSDAVNRAHYWTYPAANINCLDCSLGHSQSLDSLIAFALLHHKPFAIPETGAGASVLGHDISDDATFPLWLGQKLRSAHNAGLQIAFVGIWNNNAGANYHFSDPSDNKPLEAASWAKYFGARPALNMPH